MRELQEKLASREALETELESLYQQASELNERLKREKLNLEYEQSDVESLEGNTVKSLFYTVIGKKEERLTKEEDEADEAKRQYEGTVAELDKVNARIKRVEIDLRNLKWAERDYQNQVKELSARIEEIKTRMTDADAVTFSALRDELDSQKQNQALYAEITEEGKALLQCITLMYDALREMTHEARRGTLMNYSVAREQAEENKKLVYLRAEAFRKYLDRGIRFENDYCIDPTSIDSEIQRARIYTYNTAPNADRFVPDVPDLSLNLHGILNEIEKKAERSKQYQAELELKLSELLEKYQTT